MPETWNILKVLTWTQTRFAERGLPTARLDAELLLCHVLGCDRVRLYTHFDQPLEPNELAKYKDLIRRRIAGEPVAYLVGKKEFRSLELGVDPRVLVPRPDTETLVEVVLAALDAEAAGRVVDVGTGSGAIALALKRARPRLEVIAVDRSRDALAVARANAERLAIELELCEGDLLSPVAGRAPLLAVVSNPPYIPTGELAGLALEVQREPRAALDGGPDGLDVIRRLVAQAAPLLQAGGLLAMEVGAGQAPAVRAMVERDGRYEASCATPDLAGIERVVAARRST
jgi:release factor glutamine methyltransferase